ncbi:MAG: TldD/PmbA family protein [Anaerolineae bacterium]
MLQRLMQKAEQAEVFEIESEATKISFEANQLKSFEVEETRGVAARVVVDGRLGFAASSDVEATDRLIANVLESARHGDAIPFRFPDPQPGPSVRVYDPELAALPAERLIEMGQEMIATVLEADSEAHVNIDLERRVRRTSVHNSAGTEVATEKAPLSIMMIVERVRGDDVVVIFDYFNTAVKDVGYHVLAQRVAEKLRLARRAVTLASGRMPVIFSPSGAPVLGLPIMLGLDGKNVYRSISPMTGRVGEQLFDEKLTVVDDPTLDGRPGSSSHDDEGVPRQRQVLLDHGVLRGFIYDLKTAAQAGTEPTGHGERGLFSPPSPSFSNLILEGGDRPLAEIVAGIEEGLLVESPLGLGQGNVISGAFSNNLSLAFKIEGGEIVGRVKDVSVAGNIYEDLRYVEALSQETEWVYGGIRLPYILLPELNVVTKGR